MVWNRIKTMELLLRYHKDHQEDEFVIVKMVMMKMPKIYIQMLSNKKIRHVEKAPCYYNMTTPLVSKQESDNMIINH